MVLGGDWLGERAPLSCFGPRLPAMTRLKVLFGRSKIRKLSIFSELISDLLSFFGQGKGGLANLAITCIRYDAATRVVPNAMQKTCTHLYTITVTNCIDEDLRTAITEYNPDVALPTRAFGTAELQRNGSDLSPIHRLAYHPLCHPCQLFTHRIAQTLSIPLTG